MTGLERSGEAGHQGRWIGSGRRRSIAEVTA